MKPLTCLTCILAVGATIVMLRGIQRATSDTTDIARSAAQPSAESPVAATAPLATKAAVAPAPAAEPSFFDQPPSDVSPAAPVAAPEPQATPEPLRPGQVVSAPAAIEGETKHGRIVIPRGARLEVVSTGEEKVLVGMAGQQVTIPAAAIGAPVSLPTEAPAAAAAAVETLAPVVQAAPTLAAASTVFPALGIDVKEVGTSKGTDRKWETDYGSYQRDIYRSKALDICVRNVSRSPGGECTVSVYWMAKHPTGGPVQIAHAEELQFGLGPLDSAVANFWCPLVKESDTKYVILRERYRSGLKLVGWLVVVRRNGEPIGGKGSEPSLTSYANNAPALASLVQAYQPTGQFATSEAPKWRQRARGYIPGSPNLEKEPQ